MTKEEYSKLVKKHSPKEPKIKYLIMAFFGGGIIGLFGEVVVDVLKTCFGMSVTEAGTWLCLILIFLSSLLTGLGFFDDVFAKFRCGFIIPTTGFAHSVTSSAIDYKREGLITGIGSNMFKLAGSVILYGIISAFFLSIIWVIIYG